MLDLSKKCRICLKDLENFAISVRSEITFGDSGQELSILNMLAFCNQQIAQDISGFPEQICNDCEKRLRNSYEFHQQCEETYKTLLHWIDSNEIMLIKQEHNDIELNKMQSEDVEHLLLNDDNAKNNDNNFEFVEFRIDEQTENDKGDDTYTGDSENDTSISGNNECNLCKKTFSCYGALRRHKQIHTNREPFHCEICGKPFTRKDHMKRHIKNFHSNANNDKQILMKPIKIERTDKPITVLEVNDNMDIRMVMENSTSSNTQIDYDSDSEKSNFGNENDISTDGAYKCNACEKPFTRIAALRRHELIHSDNKPFTCEICSKGFTRKDHLTRHQQTQHRDGDSTNFQIFNCNICLKSFNRKDHMMRHRRNIHPNIDPNTMDHFNSGENIKMEHNTININEKKKKKRKPALCSICGKFFKDTSAVYRHMLTHTDERPYACEMCPKSFKQKGSLDIHRMTHLREPNENTDENQIFQCEICNINFMSRIALHLHSLIHRDSFDCKFCPENFKTRKDLREHMNLHEDKKRHVCPECGMRFRRKEHLTIHVRRHTGVKPFACTFCEKRFVSASDLQLHEKYHKGIRDHICKVCEKGFLRASELRIHMRVHTGERPYSCNYCDKKFAQKQDLDGHIREHTGERLQCEYCDEQFIHMYQLAKHKRTYHIQKAQTITTTIIEEYIHEEIVE